MMMDMREPLITAVISGLLLFVTLSAYNKVTNDPEEVMTLTHMIKITILTIIIIFMVICSSSENSRPSDIILTKFED
tara:strand:- start:155 stop:385 length:231 start_codon:yes stop_codon:yes gene_type:complete